MVNAHLSRESRGVEALLSRSGGGHIGTEMRRSYSSTSMLGLSRQAGYDPDPSNLAADETARQGNQIGAATLPALQCPSLYQLVE